MNKLYHTEKEKIVMDKIETKRLIIRKFTQGDLEDFYEYAKDLDVGPHAGWKPHESIEESKQILQMFMESGDSEWAIELKEEHKLIGSFGVHNDKKRLYPQAKEIGYVLGKAYWHQGYMQEAVKGMLAFLFNSTNVNIVSVSHFPGNNRSHHVIEKMGFHYEGLARRTYPLYNGKIADEHMFSMTKEEYAAQIAKEKNHGTIS